MTVKKQQSLKLMGRFITLARLVKANGGTIVFEWPKGARGWNEALTKRWIKEFETQTVYLDGCTQDLRSKRTGELIKKPWRLETTCEQIVLAFRPVYRRPHPHSV